MLGVINIQVYRLSIAGSQQHHHTQNTVALSGFLSYLEVTAPGGLKVRLPLTSS